MLTAGPQIPWNFMFPVCFHQTIPCSCKVCYFILVNQGEIKKHVNSEHDEYLFKCEKCDIEFECLVEQEDHNNASDDMFVVEKPVLQVIWWFTKTLTYTEGLT